MSALLLLYNDYDTTTLMGEALVFLMLHYNRHDHNVELVDEEWPELPIDFYNIENVATEVKK